MSTTDICVFVGPSLCIEEARQILPDAFFMPPVQCGDITRVLRLRPSMIVVIDGLFERVPAVWHKELLLAIRRDVVVIGGGSMGALRAAELAPLGMIGAGRSFAEYVDGTLLDDDEVAIVHTASGEALSDAMVNIRDTVDAARDENVLNDQDAEAVLSHAKASFYAERTFEGSVRTVLGNDRAAEVLAWSRCGGFRDRKRADARAVLSLAAELSAQGATAVVCEPPIVTGFLRTLAHQASASSQPRMLAGLPHHEQVGCAARFLGPSYEDARRLALLMAAVHGIGRARELSTVDPPPPWAQASSQPDGEAPVSFAARMQTIVAATTGVSDNVAQDYLLDLMRIEDVYRRHRAADGQSATVEALRESQPMQWRQLSVTARLWAAFDRACEDAALVPRSGDLQEFADRFRFVRGLTDTGAMHQWLTDNELSESDFVTLLVRWYRFEHLVPTAYLGVFEIPADAPAVWWLHDALWLTGLYDDAAAVLASPRLECCTLPTDDEDAFARDFGDGLASVSAELSAMRSKIMEAV